MDKSLNGCKATIGAFIIINRNINTKSVNGSTERSWTLFIKDDFLLQEAINVARTIPYQWRIAKSSLPHYLAQGTHKKTKTT